MGLYIWLWGLRARKTCVRVANFGAKSGGGPGPEGSLLELTGTLRSNQCQTRLVFFRISTNKIWGLKVQISLTFIVSENLTLWHHCGRTAVGFGPCQLIRVWNVALTLICPADSKPRSKFGGGGHFPGLNQFERLVKDLIPIFGTSPKGREVVDLSRLVLSTKGRTLKRLCSVIVQIISRKNWQGVKVWANLVSFSCSHKLTYFPLIFCIRAFLVWADKMCLLVALMADVQYYGKPI